MIPLATWIESRNAELDAWMTALFADSWPQSFAGTIQYPLFGGGKRIRPALCFAAFESLVGPDADRRPALPAAAAIEMIHTYSLVHDDLPAMDDDDERRGRPTVHIAYGEALAILAGDALLTEAFAVLAAAPWSPEVRVALVAKYARCAGYAGMIGGQVADIAGGVTDVDTLTRLHRLKTGALIEAAVDGGARVAGASEGELRPLSSYAANVGLAFQLADDVLDADQDAGGDGPPSFVSLLGVDETRRRAQRLAEEASALAGELPHPDRLRQLADFTVQRSV